MRDITAIRIGSLFSQFSMTMGNKENKDDMSKIELNETNSGYNLQKINNNFKKIEKEFNEKVLYRDNPDGEPNEMLNDLDMNGNRIYNLPTPLSENEAARLKDVQDAVVGNINANLIQFEPTSDIQSTNVQAAIEEVYSTSDIRLRQDLLNPELGADIVATRYGTTVDTELSRIAYAESFGASLDRNDNEVAIQEAFDAGYDTVYIALDGDIRVSSTINLNTDEVPVGAYRRSRSLILLSENARLVPTADFTGDVVVAHRQTIAQAAIPCFAVRPHFKFKIDGRDAPAGVHGFEFSGTWQANIEVWVQNMPGRGINIPARPDIEAEVQNTDDSYANIGPYVKQMYIHGCGDWGYYNEMFASGIYADFVQVQNNRGGFYTCSRDVVVGGSVSYNGDPANPEYGGLRISRTSTVTNSTTGYGSYTSLEMDSNWNYNYWAEDCINTNLIQPRMISREVSGVMKPAVMAKFGGGVGTSSTNTIVQPYIRHSQQTTNPSIVLFDFASNTTRCLVNGYHELAGGSSSRVIADDSGNFNQVVASNGRVIAQRSLLQAYELSLASLSVGKSITTALEDIVFDVEALDNNNLYNPTTGVYTVPSAGLYSINAFLNFSSLASNSSVSLHLRVNYGSGFSSLKITTSALFQSAATASLSDIRYFPSGTQIKIAAVASTGITSLSGTQNSGFQVCRIA